MAGGQGLDARMTSDRDIVTTAKLHCKRHGEAAWFEAAHQKANEPADVIYTALHRTH
jgi:hypothetical protein